MEIATYSGTKALLEKYELRPRKSLGQNFLIDRHVLEKIIRAADIGKDDSVLEIGPGLGALTQALAGAAGRLTAVELDKRLAEILSANFPAAEVVWGDILDYAIPAHVNKVVANLPYYVTTPVVMQMLENYRFKSVTVMVQKEVAQRMVSHPGKKDKSFGALSLAVQYHAEAHIAANVPQNSFMPRPKVGSAVVHMQVREKAPVTADKTALFANIKAGFGQRRKTLVNGLHSAELYPLDKEELALKIKSCGFSENVRGEELSLEDWAKLTEALT